MITESHSDSTTHNDVPMCILDSGAARYRSSPVLQSLMGWETLPKSDDVLLFYFFLVAHFLHWVERTCHDSAGLRDQPVQPAAFSCR